MRLHAALAWCVVTALMLVARPATAWIENHVLGDEIRVEVDSTGKATVEHRITLKTNGNVRFRKYVISGVDRDAVPLSNCYAVPRREAVSTSLAAATPLNISIKRLDKQGDNGDLLPAEMHIEVADKKGLRRGTYVLVIRYRSDFLARGLLTHDGAFTRVSWRSPIFDDGFDNARVTFVVPRAPTAPRAVEDLAGASLDRDEEEELPAMYIAEVRRGTTQDEVELLRTYAPKEEAVPWAVRVDPRAFESAPTADAHPASDAPSREMSADAPLRLDRRTGWAGAGLFVLILLLVVQRGREVREAAARRGAFVPPLLPIPGIVRAPIAAACVVAGLGLQLVWERAAMGAGLVVPAVLFAAHGAPRADNSAGMRGPGRWLTVAEKEVLRHLPPVRGGWLDVSTRFGKVLFLLMMGGVGVGAWWVLRTSLWHGVLVAGDGVFVLPIFGTGLARSLPPDMVVEPARFLRVVLRRLRKRSDLADVRMVPRIRIPNGGVDADEIRLLVVPRLPLRGFVAIEIGVTFAVGMGARVAMPEVLLRVVAGSPCDEAVAAISRVGRVSPGRKRDERVISFAPRFPTVRMTAEIAGALAIRVIDRSGASAHRPKSKTPAPGRRAAA